MKRNCLTVIFAASAMFALVVSQASGDDFYEGKRIRFLVHAPPGGGYDLNSRLLVRHMVNHIPGKPSIIVQNMPGAGGTIQANYLFSRAKPDGLTIGMLAPSIVPMEALGASGVGYESRKFSWIGQVANTVMVIVSRKDAPVRTLDELLDPARAPLVLGTGTPLSSLHLIPSGLNIVFTKQIGRPLFKLIPGYVGIGGLRPAFERGEIEGMPWTWDHMKATVPQYLKPGPEKGQINLIAYLALNPDQELEQLGIPFIPGRVRDKSDRTLMNFLTSFQEISLSVAAPPAMAASRLQVLRQAFMRTMKDEAYLADMRKLSMTIAPKPGEEIARVVEAALDIPPEIIARAKRIFDK